MKLEAGQKAPDFTAQNQDGKEITLSKLAGKKIVLYFYPQDNTPTCTEEACNLRDNHRKLKKQGYTVLGISPDSVKKHKNFITKFKLPFSLLSDPEHEICERYGVWAEKTTFGITYMGVLRTTFLINEDGIIEEIIEKVKSKQHAEQIFELVGK